MKIRASAIPDAALREDALEALICKRENAYGAALFWTLPRQRSVALLRLLTTYETMADFLDSANERAAATGVINGRRLHRALVDALNPGAPWVDYYDHHPWQDDCGYLRMLVQSCQANCAALPAYESVRSMALHAATLAGVQALNHESDPHQRETALRQWALLNLPEENKTSWFEKTAAASAWITVLALLAVSAKPACDECEGKEVVLAYFWISLAAAMLDSYADQGDDLADRGHSYIAYYPNFQIAVARICDFIQRSTRAACSLRDGHRHAVITASMVAMYLSKARPATPDTGAATRSLLCGGGPLAMILFPILKTWRRAYLLRQG